ncbi:PBP1A family penicillin-binding protein [Alkalibaculum sp. M08DMB]|uniref:Penicillin-binding protein 1A n=1 Tax=Alkalibaculum sporogenes TaxID=2655001 RepID=A0A6A7KB54_9FIRM|nr:PBP1A family penicillin-binding protein [Alkalibaculum sporogenes]MPW26626.1 PBP1A family penicillin-binding protein [Alkalibaculum sporogenes]
MKKRIVLATIFIVMIIFLIFGCSYSPVDVENYEYKPPEKTQVVSADGVIVGEMYNQNRTYVKLEEMPDDLINGIIAVEDSRFYEHHGYDPIGIGRALLANIRKGEITEGASTITQQLARNLFDEISTEQTIFRKINEALTARQLEKKYTKDQILEMYLNEIYLGSGTYGVQEASKEFFGKDVSELSLPESAMIAGLPQAPSAYAPDSNYELAKKRQETVLDRMATAGYITEEEARSAKNEEVVIIDSESLESSKNKQGYSAYINQVILEYQNHLQKKYPNKEISKEQTKELIENDGLTIHTTINSKMQNLALASLNEELKSSVLQNHVTGSFVTVDSASGAILAYYGGNTDIDMAKIPRQPGSAIKPLIYSMALEENIITANSLILDEPTNFNGYNPKNVGDNYQGYITIREAIVNSANIPAVKILNTLGVKKTIDFINNEFGITSIKEEDYTLTTALGGMSYGISPLEMANAYGVFANGGVKNEVYYIDHITDSNDNIIYNREYSQVNTRQVISPNTATEIKQVLIDVVNRGTGKSAKTPYSTGGKTGTTDENKDLWFVGFTGSITTAVWIGDTENKATNGRSDYSARVYGNYITRSLEENLIATEQLVKTGNNPTINISVLSPAAQENVDTNNILESQIVNILIPENQETYFNSVRISVVEVDKDTGKLFVAGKCPEISKEERYYLMGQEPVELCDKLHLINRIEDFFNGIGNGNKTPAE